MEYDPTRVRGSGIACAGTTEVRQLHPAPARKTLSITADSIADLLPVIIYQATLPHFDTTYVGAGIAGQLGFLPGEFVGDTWARFIHEEDRARVEAELAAAVERGDGFNINYRFWNKTRSGFRWFQDRGTFKQDADGQTLIHGVMTDVTEIHRLSEDLSRSEERYRTIFAASPLPMWVFDRQSLRFLIVNEAAIRHYGYSQDEFAGMTLFDIRPPEDNDALRDELERRSGGLHDSGIWRHRKRDGSIIHVHVWSRTVEFDGRDGVLVLGGDVTGFMLEKQRADELAQDVRRALVSTIEVLGGAAEQRDPYTAGHQKRVTLIACAIGQELKFGAEQLEGLRLASLVHDIGKISIPSEILVAPRKLTPIERVLMQGHPGAGHDLLKDVNFPWPLAQIVRQHHERMDGSGYPDKIKGEQILPEARVLAVADVVEAMMSHRPYRPGLGLQAALDEITRGRGSAYDSGVVDACLALAARKALPFAA